jgi:hypothetical protein
MYSDYIKDTGAVSDIAASIISGDVDTVATLHTQNPGIMVAELPRVDFQLPRFRPVDLIAHRGDLSMLLILGGRGFDPQALAYAAAGGHLEFIKTAHGLGLTMEVESASEDEGPLMHALINNHPPVVEFLYPMSGTNYSTVNMLSWAAQSGSLEAFKTFARLSQVSLNTNNYLDDSFIITAIRHDRIHILKHLASRTPPLYDMQSCRALEMIWKEMKLQMLWIFYQHGSVTGCADAGHYVVNMLEEFFHDVFRQTYQDSDSGPKTLAFIISVVTQVDEDVPQATIQEIRRGDFTRGNTIRRRNRRRLLYRITAFMIMSGIFHTYAKASAKAESWKTRMGGWGCALLGATAAVGHARCILNRIEYRSAEKLEAVARAKSANNIETLAYLTRRFMGWRPAIHSEFGARSQTLAHTVLLLAERFCA